MQVQEYKADERLKNFISSYYLIENPTISDDHIPPLGFPVIQFHLENNLHTYFSNYSFPVSPVMLVGQLTHYAQVRQTENMRLIGVNLKPTALHKITGENVSKFTDCGCPAENYLGQVILDLHKRLQVEDSSELRIHALNTFFLDLVAPIQTAPDHFDQLIETINLKKGNISQEEFYDLCPVSRRTLQRYFISRLGVSASTYLRIIRNLNLFHTLHQDTQIKLTDAMLAVGYYDYSHFSRDFRLMTGTTPKSYFEGREEFSHLLIQLNSD